MLGLSKDTWAIIAVFALILFAVHRSEAASVKDARTVAYQTCAARNAGIRTANERWANEKLAWHVAADTRRASARLEQGTQRELDLRAAATYQAVASSITPYTPTDCGAKP